RHLRRAALFEASMISPSGNLREVSDSAIVRIEDREWTESVLARLPKREAVILRARFGINPEGTAHALKEIGRQVGMSPERVRQLVERALTRIRASRWKDAERSFGLRHTCGLSAS